LPENSEALTLENGPRAATKAGRRMPVMVRVPATDAVEECRGMIAGDRC